MSRLFPAGTKSRRVSFTRFRALPHIDCALAGLRRLENPGWVRQRTEVRENWQQGVRTDHSGVKYWNSVPTKMRAPEGNLLLAALPAPARQRLTGDHAPVDLAFSKTLCGPGERIRHVYFPIDSFVSLIAPGKGRAQLEIGLVGNEGMLGVPLLLGIDVSPLRALVQGAGRAWRIDAPTFLRELAANAGLRAALNRYLYVFLAQTLQTATCARFHPVEARLARWLLMTRDRAHSNQFHVTHEFLAYMLGVRRVGVTSAAIALQRRKLIRYSRGDISVLDVRGLEATACACYEIDKKIYTRIISKGRPAT
jgi:CRP-like cAMP-binding protein